MTDVITVTDAAEKRFQEIAENVDCNTFFFGVSSGGCSGFNYILKEIKEIPDDAELVVLNGIQIAVDGTSLFALMGTEIDWQTDMMGSSFKFSNPLAEAQCGCGTSFNV